MPSGAVAFGRFRLDIRRRELRHEGEVVDLSPKVFDTLVALVERADHVAEKRELMAALWPDRVVEEANLSQNVFVLRKLLRDGPESEPYIATVPRRGYRFVREVRQVPADEVPSHPDASGGRPRRVWMLALAAMLAVAAIMAAVDMLPTARGFVLEAPIAGARIRVTVEPGGRATASVTTAPSRPR
jgi:DNA-binding winged helix-turn-helix (wHTH) protein